MEGKITSILIFFISMTFSFYSNADNEYHKKSKKSITGYTESVREQPQWYYLSSFLTNEVFRIEEETGQLLGPLKQMVPGAFASFIGADGDFFVAAQTTAEVLRFDGATGEFKGAFVEAGSGGLSKPTAPVITPDGKYVIIGDLDLNGYYRYDGQTGAFINVFAEANTSPIDGSFMPVFSHYPEFKGKILVASGFTNSIQLYDIETGGYERDFVMPGAGGLTIPIGTSFGPNGNFYVASSGTNSIKRYDGETGEYIDDFVTSGSGGLDGPRGIAFGGRNSDLYVASNNSNNILIYDRSTGAFLGESASGAEFGFEEPRGLTFSVRPSFFITALPSVVIKEKEERRDTKHRYAKIEVEFLSLVDLIDDDPKVELVSITVNDPDRDASKDIKGARIGKKDTKFWLKVHNDGDSDRVYTFTYRATNFRGGSMLATATVTVPPN